MESRPPIVCALETPLKDANLDLRMLRGAHVVSQLREVVADAPQTSLEVLRFVFVIVTTEDIKVLSSQIDNLLAPDHVIGPFLPARYDSGVGSNGAQLTTVEVHDFGVLLRRKAVIHRL